MTEITGTLTCFKYARRHRRKNVVESLVLDIVAPLPPHTLWVIRVRGLAGTEHLYRTKSGRLPKSLDPAMEDQTVTVRATVAPWANGLGAYISNVRQVVPV